MMHIFLCQTRIALIHILGDLAEDDFFGLITFDSAVFHWKRELVQATQANVDSAKRFAQGIMDRGGEIFQYIYLFWGVNIVQQNDGN